MYGITQKKYLTQTVKCTHPYWDISNDWASFRRFGCDSVKLV